MGVDVVVAVGVEVLAAVGVEVLVAVDKAMTVKAGDGVLFSDRAVDSGNLPIEAHPQAGVSSTKDRRSSHRLLRVKL